MCGACQFSDVLPPDNLKCTNFCAMPSRVVKVSEEEIREAEVRAGRDQRPCGTMSFFLTQVN